jgi:DUF1009 family protein
MSLRIIGLIAGHGSLPYMIIDACNKSNITIYPIFIEGKASPQAEQYPHLRIGEVGKAINYFKENGVTEIIFAGEVKRPNLSNIKVDLIGAKLLTKLLGAKFLGDDQLLRTIAKFFENYGFKVISPQSIFNQGITVSEGVIVPSQGKINYNDIELGLTAARALGRLDIGQSIIIEMGVVIGVEAAEGTDNLIKRCKSLLKAEKKAILVKCSKPIQDHRLDMPSIGASTIDEAYNNGLAGIAIEADKVLVIDYEKLVEKANNLGIFLISVK